MHPVPPYQHYPPPPYNAAMPPPQPPAANHPYQHSMQPGSSQTVPGPVGSAPAETGTSTSGSQQQ
jgi:pre-mRNA-splicing factor RBM22/SLT11